MSKPSCRELLDDIRRWGDKRAYAPDEDLASRVECVLALHQPFYLTGHERLGQFCAGCSDNGRVSYPCPTRRYLDGEEP